MSIHLTRRELYEMIWTRPMTKVAAQLGISDVALHKICEKHRIPAPGRGHWAKVAAGKPPKRVLFRDVSDPLVDRILIQGSSAAKLPPEVQEARAKVKAEREKRQTKPPLPAQSGQSDHPVVARLVKKLEGAKADKDGFIRLTDPKLFAMTISPAAAARALVIAERLMTCAEARVCRFDSDPGGLVLVADGESMTLHLVEQTEKVRHKPTDAEVNALRKWEADRVRRQQRGQWFGDWDKPAIPEWDYVPSGTLVFELDRGGGWDGLRRRFADTKRKHLEDMIDDVFDGALVIATARKAKRAEDARRREESEKEAQRRREAERRRVLHQKRVEVLDAQIEVFARASQIDDFVEDYLARHPYLDLPESCRRFIDWARGYAEALRRTASPETLGAKLDAHQLMDDATEIHSWVRVV
ncbi:hypothetical protein FBZ84_10638 [Azospirillum baldaniorum]|uniref:hypothetical protein n=1 Tax=Azospirillum baldaniorum TaxID=1064539 RepID=UPI0011A8F617|nr:hypothetical protein [Azospirillum baldaniorum]TWA66695.1 hypothetical protein FBZ84_10638 [Azospirillum baldaniorum]